MMADNSPSEAVLSEGADVTDWEANASANEPDSNKNAPTHDTDVSNSQAFDVHDTLDFSGLSSLDQTQMDDTGSAPDDPNQMPVFDEGDSQVAQEDDTDPSVSDVDSATRSAKFETKRGNIRQQPTFRRMHRFTLYETGARYWITGSDITDKYFKVLKIDRTAPPSQLLVFEDDITYTKQEITQLLTTIDDGNKATGGLRLKSSFWGILGFIRFTEAHYMLLITKRQQVAMIGGHYIYQVEGTELVPLTTGVTSRFARDRNAEEGRFLGILNNLDLTRSFYFSYSYDITRTLQYNISRQRTALNLGIPQVGHGYDDMFVWNHHLLSPAIKSIKNTFDWCLPIIHGFIDQASLDVFGRTVYMTIIGRRSRFFAGARFLKRGANDLGYVANDVETEQIVSEMLTTSFHAPGPRMFSNPNYTSYVHHRGSIPLYWTQDNSGVSPKPDIDVNMTDPFYQPAALHFDNLFKRYGCPIYVLNLIKSRERTPRESKLMSEFQNALTYLNQFLAEDKKIIYKAFDMSRAAKTRGGDVIGTLEVIAEEIMQKTGFFHNGDTEDNSPQVQNGVARTNCIDCLDRTNAAQFVIGKRALGHQLRALGVIPTPDMEYDSDAVNVFTHMFHDHGDTIAIQYGGSHLVNTMATYRKINHWHSQSRDMVESFKRYYHNSFLDSQRQEAYNLFLGNYIWAQGQPMLWDLSTDYYLHHTDPRKWLDRPRRNYISWYTPEHLETRTLPPAPERPQGSEAEENMDEYDDYWLEYYRPLAVSSFVKVYSYRLNTENRYLPDRPNKDTKFDFSPFTPRIDPNRNSPESPEKKPPRKGVTIVDPHSENDGHHQPTKSSRSTIPDGILRDTTAERGVGVGGGGRGGGRGGGGTAAATTAAAARDGEENAQKSVKIADKAAITQMTLNRIYEHSLNPSVTAEETAEYDRYISHPFKIPLVVSSELPPEANLEFVDYVNSGKAGGGGGGGDSREASDDDEDGRGFGGNGMLEPSDEDMAEYLDFLTVREDPLTVWEEDGGKKRYKAYRQWLRGKSLFKQSKVDPMYHQ